MNVSQKFINASLGVCLLSPLFFGACSRCTSSAEPAAQESKAKVELAVYGTALCDQSAATIRESVAAARALGPDLGLRVCMVGIAVGKGERKSFGSIHGPQEVEAGKVAVCAQAAAGGDRTKILDTWECLFSDQGGPVASVEPCAAKLGLDAASIRKCAGSTEGDNLLAADFGYAKEKRIVTTPFLTVADRPYVGVRTAVELQRISCEQIPLQERPAPCASLPEPKKLKVYAITDARCTKCDLEGSLQQLMNTVPGIEPERLDWSSEQAKSVLEKAGMPLLPALVFSEDLQEHPEVSAQLAMWIEKKGALSSFRLLNAHFDPRAEICDNGMDDTGNGKVDCADPSCTEKPVCRPEIQQRLDVFMLGSCPVAGGALGAVERLQEEMKGLKLGIHFIAFRKDGKILGMRGPNEIAEAQIELCAMKHAPKEEKGLSFSFCRATSGYKSGFEDCAEKTGINMDLLVKCAQSEEGVAALSADIELSEKLGIRRSPSFLVNNRFVYEGSEENPRIAFCSHNPQVEACGKPAPAHDHHHHDH